MQKTHTIYKLDKWNMMTVEVQGTRFVVREISTEWGEESQTFLSRPALMKFAKERFTEEKFKGTEAERIEILQAFEQI